jgi:serine protease Do
VLRNGEEVTLDITLGRLEQGEQMIADAEKEALEQQAPPAPEGTEEEPIGPPPGLPELVGFDLALIDDARRTEFGLDAGASGVVVTTVTAGSDAQEKGFVPGQIVVEVNQKPVTSVDDVTAAVNVAKDEGRPAILFKVADQAGAEHFVAVRLN